MAGIKFIALVCFYLLWLYWGTDMNPKFCFVMSLLPCNDGILTSLLFSLIIWCSSIV